MSFGHSICTWAKTRGYFSKLAKKFGKLWSRTYNVCGRWIYKHGVVVKLYWQQKTKALGKKNCPVPRILYHVSKKALVPGTRLGKRSAVPWHTLPARLQLLRHNYPSNSAEKDSLLSFSTKRLYQPAVQASGFQTVNLISALNGPQNVVVKLHI